VSRLDESPCSFVSRDERMIMLLSEQVIHINGNSSQIVVDSTVGVMIVGLSVEKKQDNITPLVCSRQADSLDHKYLAPAWSKMNEESSYRKKKTVLGRY